MCPNFWLAVDIHLKEQGVLQMSYTVTTVPLLTIRIKDTIVTIIDYRIQHENVALPPAKHSGWPFNTESH